MLVQALSKHAASEDIVTMIATEFQKQYNGTWECIMSKRGDQTHVYCDFYAEDVNETYMEMDVKDISCSIWKISENKSS